MLNTRQKQHVARVQECGKVGNVLYDLCKQIKESHEEEFSTGKSNQINTIDLENEFNFSYTLLSASVTKFCTNYIKFWDNESVTTREYGKDARAVMCHAKSKTIIQ
jgi:hypothetical protein